MSEYWAVIVLILYADGMCRIKYVYYVAYLCYIADLCFIYSDYPSRPCETDDDMMKAANSVQVAMSEFVNRAVRVNH